MKIEEVAQILNEELRKQYNNIQAVGISGNSRLIVYTTNNPTKSQLRIDECGGYIVIWKKIGKFIPIGENNEG